MVSHHLKPSLNTKLEVLLRCFWPKVVAVANVTVRTKPVKGAFFHLLGAKWETNLHICCPAQFEAAPKVPLLT